MGAGFSYQVVPGPPTAESTQELQDAKNKPTEWIQRYDAMDSRYADFTEANKELEETTKALKPRRPPTAPAEDLSKERQLLLRGPGIDVLMIQVALFCAVLSLLSFLVFSRDVAQGLTFLLLCTGVAIGFFLRK